MTDRGSTTYQQHVVRPSSQFSSNQHYQTQTHLLDNELGMIDEEEAMPLRPMTQSGHYHRTVAGVTLNTQPLFSSEDNHSDVKDIYSFKDEMNDTGLVELI